MPDAVSLDSVHGHIAMEHVKFGYDPGKTIIHDLNLDARPGSLVAIVGPTGAGKTTIINLLMRFYDPDSGSICLDSHPIQTITRKSLRLAYACLLYTSTTLSDECQQHFTFFYYFSSENHLQICQMIKSSAHYHCTYKLFYSLFSIIILTKFAKVRFRNICELWKHIWFFGIKSKTAGHRD